VYVDAVMMLNFLVDFFLLLGTNRLSGYPPGGKRAAAAAGIGGVYGGLCLLPGFRFLGSTLWRCVSLAVMSGVAFGWKRSALRRGVLFCLLSMALGGTVLFLGGGGATGLAGGVAGIALLCYFGFRGSVGKNYVPVFLRYGRKNLQLTALRDTGNTLRDPITGCSVLVIGADAAAELTGLTQQQLRDPVATLQAASLPGLRLIPFRSVGNPGGMLLGLRLEEVRIGHQQGSRLVAFSPEKLSGSGEYQALTGGM